MEYATHLSWQGSTGAGYRTYDRGHTASAPPAEQDVVLSADPAFRGDPGRLNPEQLVVMAASSCQLLSFLAVAARAGVDVVAYVDDARGTMAATEGVVRLNLIELRPVITVAGSTDAEQVRALVEQAHEECYVANSLLTDVRVLAEVVTR